MSAPINHSSSSPQASTFSKWLSHQVFLDEEEMCNLLKEMGEVYLFSTGVIYPEGQGEISQETFLNGYTHYVDSLKKGKIPDEASYRTLFSVVFTQNKDHVFPLAISEGRQIFRVSKPVIQLQQHRFDYSTADEKFYPMVFGQNSILWGVQFSYPQLYQDGMTKQILNVTPTLDFPNTLLFRKIQLWIRRSTIPTPFMIKGKKINVPMRLGKECLHWINSHPQLLNKDIQVYTGEN